MPAQAGLPQRQDRCPRGHAAPQAAPRAAGPPVDGAAEQKPQVPARERNDPCLGLASPNSLCQRWTVRNIELITLITRLYLYSQSKCTYCSQFVQTYILHYFTILNFLENHDRLPENTSLKLRVKNSKYD